MWVIDAIQFVLEREQVQRGTCAPIEKIEAELDRIKQSLMSIGEREIKSIQIGEAVMEALNRLDKVAYVRFASVYKDFKDLKEFQNEINRIQDLVD